MATLIQNKKIRLDYEIMKTFEAGVELFGYEVKSLKGKQGNLEGSHITVRGGEVFVIGMSIPPYQQANTPTSYEPERNRKLLLTKKEIGLLADSESKKGLTIVPISVYNKARKLKLEIAIVRGKKKHDKRETLKARDAKRDIDREIKKSFH
jgi:SsrA-binding protein